MQVKLKVLFGTNAGKELKVTQPEFVIGREEGCHLRPQTDTVSRKHCVIKVVQSQVTVRDLGSLNGVFVNGHKIADEIPLKSGDRLQIGKLLFELVVEAPVDDRKRQVVKDIKDATSPPSVSQTSATRLGWPVEKDKDATSPATSDSGLDTDISDWLAEADEAERTRRLDDFDTRQFEVDEADRAALEKGAKKSKPEEDTSSDASAKQPKGKKKGPGKPPSP